MSRRLIITLEDEQYEILNELAQRTRISMAEHIRTCVDKELRPWARPNLGGFTIAFTRRPDEPFVGRRPGIKLD
jgi:ribbon-helix-helix CopG family protein